MSALPPIWVINLARSPERLTYVTEHLNALGLPFERIAAVDGRTLTDEEINAVYDPPAARLGCGRELAAGEIGCALTHLALYRRMIDAGVEEALILEDDAVVDPAIHEVLARRPEWPADRDILFLYHARGRMDVAGSIPLRPGLAVGRLTQGGYGTVGYLIRRRAAARLLRHALPLRGPADHWAYWQPRLRLRLYGVEPPCVAQRFAEDDDYTTMPERERFRGQAPSGIDLLPGFWRRLGYRLRWALQRWSPR